MKSTLPLIIDALALKALRKRNAARLALAIEQMGASYICHRSQFIVKRLPPSA